MCEAVNARVRPYGRCTYLGVLDHGTEVLVAQHAFAGARHVRGRASETGLLRDRV